MSIWRKGDDLPEIGVEVLGLYKDFGEAFMLQAEFIYQAVPVRWDGNIWEDVELNYEWGAPIWWTAELPGE